MSEYFDTCSTRDRARAFYPRLADLLRDMPRATNVVLSFEDVAFVSPSFLDELLVKLAQDEPEVARRLILVGVSSFVAERLRSVLSHRKVPWTLSPRSEEGSFQLA
jgi:hypothetical protein